MNDRRRLDELLDGELAAAGAAVGEREFAARLSGVAAEVPPPWDDDRVAASNGWSAEPVVVRRVVRAREPVVFGAFVETTGLHRWLGPPGYRVVDAVIDPRAGGTYAYRMRAPDGDWVTVEGNVLAINPPIRLAMTWRLNSRLPGPMEVDVRFRPLLEAEPRTEVVVRHHGARGELAELHRFGWTSSLERLAGLFD